MPLIDEENLTEEELRKISGSVTLTDVETYYQATKKHDENEARQRRKARAVLIAILIITAIIALYFGFGFWLLGEIFAEPPN